MQANADFGSPGLNVGGSSSERRRFVIWTSAVRRLNVRAPSPERQQSFVRGDYG